jgi:hypothetical protein
LSVVVFDIFFSQYRTLPILVSIAVTALLIESLIVGSFFPRRSKTSTFIPEADDLTLFLAAIDILAIVSSREARTVFYLSS